MSFPIGTLASHVESEIFRMYVSSSPRIAIASCPAPEIASIVPATSQTDVAVYIAATVHTEVVITPHSA